MNVSYDSSFPYIYNAPLECQAIVKDSETFLSDGFHTVLCEFTDNAMIAMRHYYPTVSLKDLDKNLITLLEYRPIILSERRHSPVIRVYDFCIDPVGVVGNPKNIAEDCEMRRIINFERQRHVRQQLLNSDFVNNLPPLEEIIMGNRGDAESRSTSCERDRHDKATQVVFEDIIGRDTSCTEESKRREAKERRERNKAKKLFKELSKGVEEQRKPMKDGIRADRSFGLAKRRVDRAAPINPISPPKTSFRNSFNWRLDKQENSVMNENAHSERDNSSEAKRYVKEFKNLFKWNKKELGCHSSNIKSAAKESALADFAASGRPFKKLFKKCDTALKEKKRKAPENADSYKKSTKKSKL